MDERDITSFTCCGEVPWCVTVHFVRNSRLRFTAVNVGHCSAVEYDIRLRPVQKFTEPSGVAHIQFVCGDLKGGGRRVVRSDDVMTSPCGTHHHVTTEQASRTNDEELHLVLRFSENISIYPSPRLIMRILVTGGAGFIGSNFVHLLLDETDYDITTLDALTYAGSTENLGETLENERHEFIEGDIRNRDLVADLLVDIDVVINFAAESHVDRSIDGAEPFVTTNVQGTQVLLDAAVDADIDRFIQISTDEVYGEIEEGTFSEEDRLSPRNPYSATKAGADLLARSYQTTHSLPVIVTRSSNNFGPRQHPEKLVPKFLMNAAEGRALPVYGDGTNVREWIYVEDNCRALLTVLEEGESGEVYNIGSGVEKQNIEVTRAIIDAVGASEELIEFVEDRAGHDQRYALDASKIESLGWEPRWSFEEGIDATVEYYLG